MKHCKKCDAETERDKRGKCRPCGTARAAAYYIANREMVGVKVAAYQAAHPDMARAKSAAWTAAHPGLACARAAAWYATNTARALAAGAAYRAVNPDKLRAVNAAYRAANPEKCRIHRHNRRARMREAVGTLSHGLAEKLFKLQKGKCTCGCKQPLGDSYHMDHVMPLALGGSNLDDNIQLLRQRCNNQKCAKHPIEFMQQRGFLL